MNSAADALLGVSLDGGWRVVEKLEPGETGGNFCVPYIVEGPAGERGFCKALNLSRALSEPDPAAAMQPLIAGFNFERELLHRCRGLSKVITAVGDGVAAVEGYAENVNYIIFEQAQFDIRRGLDLITDLGTAGRLRSLQNAATGLKQLHTRMVAHQDVKPSNVLLLHQLDSDSERITKIGDLGRAFDGHHAAPHDKYPIAGDPTYAPPEQLYGATPTSYEERRLACDIYQFGSLIAFVFSGSTINALLQAHLSWWHHWVLNQGELAYQDMLPYIRDAFGRSVRKVREECPKSIAEPISQLVEDLCDPEPARRGHRLNRRGTSVQYDLHRVITDLNLLYYRVKKGLIG
jgi:eukaryotic-like serine/threonine-protein kinase